jgi:LacI family transcriptional regulator
MLQGFADGVISFSFYAEDEYHQSLRDSGIVVEELTSRNSVHGEPRISTGVSMAIDEMMDYLVNKGHRRIAHLAGSLNTPPGRYRLYCYKKALENIGVGFDKDLVIYGTFRRRDVPDLMTSLFRDIDSPDRPTALFAANDVMAIEALHWLIQQGWRVPEDVAVCGFDNIPETSVVTPTLTTIDQNPSELGRRTALAVINQINGQESEKNLLSLSCKLVIRNST